MPRHHYQLTYSISPINDQRQAEAQKARRAIKESSRFTKIEHLETVVVGTLLLEEESQSDRRREAQKDITNLIRGMLINAEVLQYVYVHCSLMVDGLGKHMTFDF